MSDTENKGNVGKIIGIGCVVILLVAGIGMFAIYKKFTGKINELVDEYTTSEQVEFGQPAGTAEDADAVVARFDKFAVGLKSGQDVKPLVLTEDEVNQLIYYHPRYTEMADKVRVSIDGDKVGGSVSIPLTEMAKIIKALEGRYLNGSAAFTISLADGELLVFLQSMEVNGQAVPDEFMASLSAENLAEEFNKKPENRKESQMIESIEVSNDTLTITPKPASDRPGAAVEAASEAPAGAN